MTICLITAVALPLLVDLTRGWGKPPPEERSTAVWHEVRSAGEWVGADATGFWTSAGEHFGFDGSKDVTLTPAFPFDTSVKWGVLDDGVGVAAVTRDESLVPSPGSSALVVARYGRKGQRLWQKTFGGERPDSPIVGVDAVSEGAKGAMVIGGQFSGCVTFGKRSKPCVDEKLAKPFGSMCEGDYCAQPFAVALSRGGDVVDVETAPGIPAHLSAGARDGTVAFAGIMHRDVDLNPEAGAAAWIRLPKKDRRNSHAFVSVSQPGGKWSWGRAVLGDRASAVDSIVFGPDNVLWLALELGRGNAASLVSGDGTSTALSIPAGVCKVIVRAPTDVGPKPEPSCSNDASFGLPQSEAARVSLFPAGPTMFMLGPFGPVAGARRIVGGAQTTERVLMSADQRWALRIPADFSVGAVSRRAGEVCIGFTVSGPQKVLGTGGEVSLGRPRTSTHAIACFSRPAGDEPATAH